MIEETAASTAQRAPTDEIAVWRRRGIVAWAMIGIIVLILFAGAALLRVVDAFVPFVAGGLIAFLARPLLRMFMRFMPRGLAVAAVFLLVLAVVAGLVALLLPLVTSQLSQFATAVPQYWNQIQATLSKVVDQFKLLPSAAKSAIDQVLAQAGQSTRAAAQAIAQFLLAAGGGALGFGFNVFLGFIIAIWLLLDGPKISKWMLWVLPPGFRDHAYQIGRAFNDSFGGYIRGTIINMSITFAGCAIGFTVIGLPYSIFVALAIGILDVIPYIGPIVGGILATLLGFIAGGWSMAALVLLIVLVIEQTVDSVISPIVMGESVSLHPVAILLSLGLGGALWGFFGVLISIPAAAAIYTLYLYYAGKDRDSFETFDPESVHSDPTPGPAKENA
jgi:predicted PurR-regulated permease PerM